MYHIVSHTIGLRDIHDYNLAFETLAEADKYCMEKQRLANREVRYGDMWSTSYWALDDKKYERYKKEKMLP